MLHHIYVSNKTKTAVLSWYKNNGISNRHHKIWETWPLNWPLDMAVNGARPVGPSWSPITSEPCNHVFPSRAAGDGLIVWNCFLKFSNCPLAHTSGPEACRRLTESQSADGRRELKLQTAEFT